MRCDHSVGMSSSPADWTVLDTSTDYDFYGSFLYDTVTDTSMLGLYTDLLDFAMYRSCVLVARDYPVALAFSREIVRRPSYYHGFGSVSVRIGSASDGSYLVYGTLKAYRDVLCYSMFVGRGIYNKRRSYVGLGPAHLIEDALFANQTDVVFSVNNLLRDMSTLAFGYPLVLGAGSNFSGGDLSGRAYGGRVVLMRG